MSALYEAHTTVIVLVISALLLKSHHLLESEAEEAALLLIVLAICVYEVSKIVGHRELSEQNVRVTVVYEDACHELISYKPAF
jgi:hypothetical protein